MPGKANGKKVEEEGEDCTEERLHGVEKKIGPCPIRVGLSLRDRFRVEELIGQGTRGLVFIARRLDDNERVVLKVSDTSKELRNEIWITQEGLQPTIRSPAAYETFKLMRKPWAVCVMEVLGDNLLGLFDQYKFNESKLLYASKHMLEGLAGAHDAKIAHCDIQPLNICESLSGGVWRLIDWGMAQDMGKLYAEKRLGQGPRGCVAYRSPEMLADSNWDLSTDVWSSGIIIAELYLGEFWNAPRSWEENPTDILSTMEKTFGKLPGQLRRSLGERTSFGIPYKFYVRFPPLLASVLRQILHYSSTWRVTARDALKHAWFAVPSQSTEDLEAWLYRTFVDYEKEWKISDVLKGSVAAVIELLASRGEAERAQRWLRRSLAGELPPDLGAFSAVVEALQKERRTDDMAERWVLEMAQRHLKPKEEFCVEAVRTCALRDGFEKADALVRKLDKKGARPSSRVFTQLLAPAAKAGQFLQAEQVFRWLVDKGLEPDAGVAAAIFQSYANAPHPDPDRAMDMAQKVLALAPVCVSGPVKVALDQALGRERFDCLSQELDFVNRNTTIAAGREGGRKGGGSGKGRRGFGTPATTESASKSSRTTRRV